MRFVDMVTAVRAKVGEPDSNNSKWTDQEVKDAINAVKQRAHGWLAEAAPEGFNTEIDVVLPANAYTATIPWPGGASPGRVVDIWEITDGTPGTKIYPINWHERHARHGQGIHNNILFSTYLDSDARTYRIGAVDMVGTDLAADTDQPEDIPAHLHRDLLVYGAAIELANEMPSEIPQHWWVVYTKAERALRNFAERQTMDQGPRYGDQYLSEELDGQWRRDL